jgi:nicotinamidase-related amidase
MARLYRKHAFGPLAGAARRTDNQFLTFEGVAMSATPRRALLVIDVQNEYFTGKLRIEYPPLATSLPNIVLAMDTAASHGVPVILVQHQAAAGAPVFGAGSHGWQNHAEVAARPFDHHIVKQQASAFAGTDLANWLTAHAVDTVSIVGYMTHNCDAATIYQAAQTGYNVEFLADATGALPYENAAGKASAEEIHRVYSTVFHTGFAAVASTAQWVAAVAGGVTLDRDNIVASNQRARQPLKSAQG